MLSTAASDMRRTLKSRHLLSFPSRKSHDMSNPESRKYLHRDKLESPAEEKKLKHLLLTAVQRTTLSTKFTNTRNNLTIPSNYFSESGDSIKPIHSFQLLHELQTPKEPTQNTISSQSNKSTEKKPFCPLTNPALTKLNQLKKQGYVWWGSFGADALTHDIPLQVRSISLRSQLVSIRGYALEFKPLKSNILLPLLIRRKEKSAILRADLIPGEALKSQLKISISSYAKSLQRIKSDNDNGDRAYDAIIRATNLEEIPLYFPTSSLYAKLSVHMQPEFNHQLPSPLCIASMLNGEIIMIDRNCSLTRKSLSSST